jgi:hypothetical protein
MDPHTQNDVNEQAPQPVAYDADGRTLYAAPPPRLNEPPQFVHVSRPVTPLALTVSDEVKVKHDASVK